MKSFAETPTGCIESQNEEKKKEKKILTLAKMDMQKAPR
jgi:hypothetical protein